MTALPGARKNKIVLSDYPYEKDIENRLFLSSLTPLEVSVITEIIDGSLKTTATYLQDYLGISQDVLSSILKKLEMIKLIKKDGDQIHVQKEMRKYFDIKLAQFEEGFKPNVDYLQSLLAKVPIHCLPQWYTISRSSDNIFESIIDKTFSTPRCYERYLSELHFDYPPLDGVLKDLFTSETFSLTGEMIRERYNLTNEQFIECTLHLEFNFVAFLCHEVQGDRYVEVLRPLAEWQEFLELKKRLRATPIEHRKEVKRAHPSDFGFIEDAKTLCEKLMREPQEKTHLFNELPSLSKTFPSGTYLDQLVEKLQVKDFVSQSKNKLCASQKAKEWIPMSLQEQAIIWYRTNIQVLFQEEQTPFSDKDVRHVEKALKDFCDGSWYLVQDFIERCLAPIGDHEEITLKKQGRLWSYVTPTYSKKDQEFLEHILVKHFFECGMIALGEVEEGRCFKVTPFGCASFGE